MKKLVLGVLAAALMSFGLAAAPAEAAPYPGSVASAPIKKVVKAKPGSRPKVRLAAVSGSAKPRGYAHVSCRRAKGTKSAPHRHGKVRNGRVPMPRLGKGKWRCYVKFNGKGVYKNGLHVVKVRVR